MGPVDREDLIRSLDSVVNAKRSNRERARDLVLRHPQLFPQLMNLVLDTEDKLHVRAAWVAELVCVETIDLLACEAQRFIQNLSRLTDESALRPVSKMAYLLSKAHFQAKEEGHLLDPAVSELLIASSFDWLIAEHKVATQVFAMKTLFLWSAQIPWIRQELRLILEQNAGNSSMAYRAATRKILEKI